MIVVADSSPLHYLILVRQIDVLPRLFERVAIPTAVKAELTDAFAPQVVKEWFLPHPKWLEVHQVTAVADSSLLNLDPGEREAILLACELAVRHVLADDLKARAAAEHSHLVPIGTIGILRRASAEGLLDFTSVFAELSRTNFRMSTALRKAVLKELERTNEEF